MTYANKKVYISAPLLAPALDKAEHDDLVIIVRSSNNSHFQRSKHKRKMSFQWICNKSHFVWFSSLLQTFWAAEKAQIFIPIDPWFLRRRHFYFAHVFWCG